MRDNCGLAINGSICFIGLIYDKMLSDLRDDERLSLDVFVGIKFPELDKLVLIEGLRRSFLLAADFILFANFLGSSTILVFMCL